MSGMGSCDHCEGPCSSVHAVCVLASARSRNCELSLWVFVAFVSFSDICHFRCAGMSCRVDSYSLSGGGSIGTLPGVVPAAWGGPRRARRAVRAAPKTGHCGTSKVKDYGRSFGSIALP
jgi:hypothetical protein